MKSSKPNSLRGVFFAAGLVVGGAAGGMIASWSIPRSSVDAAQVDSVGDVAEASIDDVRAQLAVARQELARARAKDAEPVREVTAKPEAEPKKIVRVKKDELDARLASELERLILAGGIRAKFRGKNEQLFQFLVDGWLSVGRPELAHSLIAAFDRIFDVGKSAMRVGYVLQKSKNKRLAAEAYLLAMGSQTTRAINALLGVAPKLGLAALQDAELARKKPKEVNLGKIRFLVALGRGEEAIEFADSLLGTNKLVPAAWASLVKASPAEAEKRLAKLTSKDPNQSRFYQLQLAEAIRAQGRNTEAIQKLEAGLAKKLDNAWLEKLGKIDRTRAISFLEKRTLSRPNDAKAWGAMGDQLLKADRKGEAFQALARAYGIKSNDRYAALMLKADARRGAVMLEGGARAAKNDEVLGDIADALWKAGERSRASSLWREAQRIDPDDSEWIRKAKAVNRGRDPFQR